MTCAEEAAEKLARVRRLLAEKGLRGALLAAPGGFAWLTGGGRNHVSMATERGVGAILVTPDEASLLADNIERRRLEEEELPEAGFSVREFPWWSGGFVEEALRVVAAEELLTDFPLPGAQALGGLDAMRLRNPLLPVEVERYRKLGQDAAVILTHVAFHCRPSLSEHQLAAMLAKGLMDFGITPGVTLVAVDERASTRRHPLPTDRGLERYAMLVIGGRRAGLHLSATRLVHFGRIPEELLRRQEACVRVDAALLGATRPGRPLAKVFQAGVQAYAAEGFPDEWRLHHQGGPTGYGARDLKVTPDAPGEVLPGQAFAWNPSIAGVKSEDTVLVGEDGIEVLCVTSDLPVIEVDAGGQRITRAGILER